MKKITHYLKFLAILFFLFLALALCFAFNKVLDQKIEAQHSQALESLSDFNAEPETP